MILIYNNKKYEINIENNISIYHLSALIYNKYGLLINENYIISNLSGELYSNSSIVKNNDNLIIRKKLKGGSDSNPNDSDILNNTMNSMGFFIAVFGGFYYLYYLSGIILNITKKKELSAKIEILYKQIIQKGGKNDKKEMIEMKNLSGDGDGDKQVNQITNNESKFSLFFKKFSEMISDDQFKISVCSFQNIFPYFELYREDVSNINMTITSSIFFTYFIAILTLLFINPITTSHCGTPNGGVWILTLIMIFIPLILVHGITYITTFFDFIARVIFKKKENIFENYKLATSNIILLILLIIYCIINIKGISPFFGFMIPIFMILFGIIDFVLKKTKILGTISRFLGNIITNTDKIPNEHYDYNNLNDPIGIKDPYKIKKNKENHKDNYPNAECYYRFDIIYNLLYGILASIFGKAFFSFISGKNIKYCCPS
jgi:hypothetical protein